MQKAGLPEQTPHEKFHKKKNPAVAGFFLGGQWGSNPRPSVPQTDILTN
jgi:hypothetical protein